MMCATMACTDNNNDPIDNGADDGTGPEADMGVMCFPNEELNEATGECEPVFPDVDFGMRPDMPAPTDMPPDMTDCEMVTVFIDRDEDGVGVNDPSTNQMQCLGEDEVPGCVDDICYARASAESDCDDENNQRWPGRPESCDGFDNDCDNDVNEGLTCEFFAQTGDDLYLIDPFRQLATPVASSQVNGDESLQDMDTDPSTGELYAVTRTAFYRFIRGTGTWAELAVQGLNVEDANGLAINRDGTAFITSQNQLYTIDLNANPLTGRFVGTMGELYSSGDCVVNKEGELFMTSKRQGENDKLVLINTNTAAAEVVGTDTGFDRIFGLTAAWGKLYGLTGEREVLEIDRRTGAASLIYAFPMGDISGGFFGAASTPER